MITIKLLVLTTFSFFFNTQATRFTLDGHVAHGINTFNDKLIVNYTGVSNIFSPFPPIYEIGVINPGSINSSVVTEKTPLDSIVATIDSFNFRNLFQFPQGVGPFNVPITQVPTIYFLSTNINDRLTPRPFSASKDPALLAEPYLAGNVKNKITLEDWNRARGRMHAKCKNGKAWIKITLANGLPNSLYSVTDVGVLNPLTPNETVSGTALGGVPNVLVTDNRGNGVFERPLNYCPFDSCNGTARCSLYIALFYHFDHMIYGASTTLDSVGQGVGLVGSNHIKFFPNGEMIL